MKDLDCIFCKIIDKKLPAQKLLETNKLTAILDINPINQGHTLIIPKQHCETLWTLPESIYTEVIQVINKVSRAICKSTGAKGFNLIQSNGACAGQEIHHVHFHIIPRYDKDGIKFGFKAKKYQNGEMAELANTIRSCI